MHPRLDLHRRALEREAAGERASPEVERLFRLPKIVERGLGAVRLADREADAREVDLVRVLAKPGASRGVLPARVHDGPAMRVVRLEGVASAYT